MDELHLRIVVQFAFLGSSKIYRAINYQKILSFCNVVKIAFTPFNPSETPCLSAFMVKAPHFLRVHALHQCLFAYPIDRRL